MNSQTNPDQHTAIQFDHWAKTYDTKALNHYYFYKVNQAVLKLLQPGANSSLLDVGCGTGILLEQLASTRDGMHLYGLDVSEGMLAWAKQKLAKYSNVELQLGSVAELPYEDNRFDYVTCIQSFHHHPDSMQSLRQMHRVLKPGGSLLIHDVSLDGPLRKSSHWLEKSLYPEREADISRYTRVQMEELFQKAGFGDIQQRQFWYFSLITVGKKVTP